MSSIVGVSFRGNKYRPWLTAMVLWRSVASLEPQFLKSCLCTDGVSRLRLSSTIFPATVNFPRYASTMPPGEPVQIEIVKRSEDSWRVWPALPDRANFATEGQLPAPRLSRQVRVSESFLLSSNLLSIIEKCRKREIRTKGRPLSPIRLYSRHIPQPL